MRSTCFQAHAFGTLPPKPSGTHRKVPKNGLQAARASSGYDYQDPVVPTPALGNRVEAWLKTPMDILTFGPRATVGALLSLPERAQTLQQDLDRINMLLQDPRSLDDKRDELAKEVESALVQCMEKGAGVEADVLASLTAVLPPELRDAMPEELRAALGRSGAPAASAPTAYDPPAVDFAPVPAATVAANQIAAEMAELREAVKGLRGAIGVLAANVDPAQDKVLRLNVREARRSAAIRLQQLSPATLASPDESISAAISEATALLADVDSLGV
ncbi:g1639 [Coccomyxa elongata]